MKMSKIQSITVGFLLLVVVVVASASASITVLSPNGGETWNKGTSYPITWSYTGSVGSKVNVALFRDDNFLNYLASNVPIGSGGAGSYTWLIPAGTVTGSNYKIGVQSSSYPGIYDLSNTVFTIGAGVPPTITVTSPNGAESWVIGSTHAVTWTSSGDVGANVKIEVLKAGSVVQTLSSSDPNDGTYSWTIATTLVTGTDYRIRITSATNTAIKDSSDADFALTQAPTTGTTHFGEWQFITTTPGIDSYSETATTDGFVMGYCSGIGPEGRIYGATGSSSLLDIIAYAYRPQRTFFTEITILMPIRKGDLWRVWWENCDDRVKIKWLPLTV